MDKPGGCRYRRHRGRSHAAGPPPHRRRLSMTATEAPVAPVRWRGAVLFWLLSMGYFVVGAVLMLRYNIFEPDAPNRVANAGFALHSRDPHLSAIGFVWNPLPSLVELPLVWLSQWWPILKYAG